ncbi:MAG: NADH-quinone oxidoreductase subunit C [Hymenobacteraceae bacterium]|nr:NADH-quinone oxidoreductase subunit C [Hymenobacteraceae bacterium]MDX5395845.1 NADH-quinone oxidoreductase subunit C [Hymenobacteraceae bacterium]MDX5442648.1 NADH-quinone oxidoreductase subunit C [Hymenobacteraceae bacterium]MDX5511900.1 NADH-quinone oxidoreductase subunit C [Hymenobacteraceae bacterium]
MTELNNQTLLEEINRTFGDAITDAEEPYGLLTITTNRDTIYPLLQFLKEHEFMQFNFLTTLCGMHYPENKDKELGVFYHVHSFIHNVRIRIKVFFPVSDPTMPTVTTLWKTANWMERETYDFFGVIFKGHPDLRRILNVDEMTYFPMRKEHPLEDPTREDKIDTYFGR